MPESPFAERVATVLASLRPGQVVSYGEVAAEAGHPGAARAVGRLLHASRGWPWWRVVAADGRLLSPDAREQARLLAAEGVRIHKGRVAAARAGGARVQRGRGANPADGKATNHTTPRPAARAGPELES